MNSVTCASTPTFTNTSKTREDLMRRYIITSLTLVVSTLALTACQVGSHYVQHDHHYTPAEPAEPYYTVEEETYDDEGEGDDVYEVESGYDEETTYAAHTYSGYTECGNFMAGFGDDNECQPGSYCADATFSRCAPGCLSDQNCSPEQVCVKATGRNKGTCQAY